jgi:predicted AAA+ superfamily ATPase
MFNRTLRAKLERAMGRSPVVLLTGARQTGKTTLVKQAGAAKQYNFVSFDDLRFLAAARNDPMGFIEGLAKPVILDEVQRVPEIFLPIKHDVDLNREPGRYLLTGSANPLLIPRLGDSLAGRMEILNMLPLSQGELIGNQDFFVDQLMSDWIPSGTFSQLSKEDLCSKIVTGGFPAAQGADDESRDAWFESYITTILQRDVQDLARIEGLTALPRLLHLLAARSSGLLNGAELARTAGLASTTLHRYLALLETLFLVHLQLPWSQNLGKRLVKAPKVYLVDTGLLAFLLGADKNRIIADGKLVGGIFENFVVGELRKQLTWCKTRASLFHLRSQSGVEVDIILEDAAGRIVGIEIKSSDSVMPSDFKGLRYLEEVLGDKFLKGILVYTGAQIIPFGNKLFAVPVQALWG